MDEVPEDANGACDDRWNLPRDPPQRDTGNRGRALIDTGYVGGEARDAAMSRVREKLDLQSGTVEAEL